MKTIRQFFLMLISMLACTTLTSANTLVDGLPKGDYFRCTVSGVSFDDKNGYGDFINSSIVGEKGLSTLLRLLANDNQATGPNKLWAVNLAVGHLPVKPGSYPLTDSSANLGSLRDEKITSGVLIVKKFIVTKAGYYGGNITGNAQFSVGAKLGQCEFSLPLTIVDGDALANGLNGLTAEQKAQLEKDSNETLKKVEEMLKKLPKK